MGIGKGQTDYLLSLIREGKQMTLGQQLRLTAYLSVPAIMAQVSSIAMQYIDASMVGNLGANAAASIGLVSTTTWLFWGLCAAAATGFSVQVAHRIGAGDFLGARKIFRQSIAATLVFSSLLAVVGISISGMLPDWLDGDEAIRSDSSLYFWIFALFLPALQLNFLAGGMLRCSGNMRVPSMLNVLMCLLDVVFNFFLIFPPRQVECIGNRLIPTEKGLEIYGIVGDKLIADAAMTAAWEEALREIEEGRLSAGKFMKGIHEYARKIVSELLALQVRNPGVTRCACPKCGTGTVTLYDRVAKCGDPDCAFHLPRMFNGREMTDEEMTRLMAWEATPFLKFTTKAGKPYEASLRMDENYKVELTFKDSMREL